MNILSNLISIPEKGLCFAVANYNANWLSSAYTIFDATIVHNECRKPAVTKHYHKIQLIFNTLNFAWCSYEVTKLAYQLHARAFLLTPYSAIGLLGSLIASVALYKLLNKQQSEKDLLNDVPETEKSKLQVHWSSPISQTFAKVLYISRLVANIGLMCFSPAGKITFALNIATLGYSLVNLSKMKWLKFEHSIQDVKFFLFSSILHFKTEEKCSKCDAKGDTYFCDRLVFHIPCFVRTVFEKSANFLNPSNVLFQDHKTDRGARFRTYQITIPKKEVPIWTSQDPSEHLSASVKDPTFGNCGAQVNVIDSKNKPSWLTISFFERLNLVYNIFQASLASIQQSHYELMSSTIQLQRFMLPLDIIALFRDIVIFQNSVKINKNKKNSCLAFAGGIAMGLAGVFATFGVNRFFAPTINPKDLLVTSLSLSSEAAEKIRITWERPLIDRVIQWVLFCRISLNLGTALFSSNRFVNVTNAGLQALTLYRMSQLPWLRMDYIQTENLPKEVSLIATKLYYMMKSKTAETMSSDLQKIYSYVKSMFTSSVWKSFWVYERYAPRHLNFNVYLKPEYFTKTQMDPLLVTFSGTAKSLIPIQQYSTVHLH